MREQEIDSCELSPCMIVPESKRDCSGVSVCVHVSQTGPKLSVGVMCICTCVCSQTRGECVYICAQKVGVRICANVYVHVHACCVYMCMPVYRCVYVCVCMPVLYVFTYVHLQYTHILYQHVHICRCVFVYCVECVFTCVLMFIVYLVCLCVLMYMCACICVVSCVYVMCVFMHLCAHTAPFSQQPSPQSNASAVLSPD